MQALNALCDRAEDADGHAPVVLRVSGAPTGPTATPPLPLVNKWERALRRLERLDRPTVALVGGDTGGDCGGTAVEALLATDYRIAHPATRLLPPAARTASGPAWPCTGSPTRPVPPRPARSPCSAPPSRPGRR